MRFDPSARDLTKAMMEQRAGERWRNALRALTCRQHRGYAMAAFIGRSCGRADPPRYYALFKKA